MANERHEVVRMAEVATATIANGESLSGAVQLGGMYLSKIALPAEFDGTAITFQGSLDGSTFYNLYTNAGTEVNYPASASRVIVPEFMDFLGLHSIKVRAGTAGAATNQTGATVVSIGLNG